MSSIVNSVCTERAILPAFTQMEFSEADMAELKVNIAIARYEKAKDEQFYLGDFFHPELGPEIENQPNVRAAKLLTETDEFLLEVVRQSNVIGVDYEDLEIVRQKGFHACPFLVNTRTKVNYDNQCREYWLGKHSPASIYGPMKWFAHFARKEETALPTPVLFPTPLPIQENRKLYGVTDRFLHIIDQAGIAFPLQVLEEVLVWGEEHIYFAWVTADEDKEEFWAKFDYSPPFLTAEV